MNLDKIWERIHYGNGIAPTLSVLTELQNQFLLHVPFENLDIHLEIPMDFSEQALFDKIVERKRGGLCFENNSLFYAILKQIGFTVQFVSAEMYQNRPFSGIINHMALLVSIKKHTYLVDVGNGRSYGSPVPIYSSELIKGEDASYLVDEFQGFKTLMFFDQNGQIQPRYAFNPEPKQLKDFIEPSIYTQKSPESIFRQKILVTQYQDKGRMTLSDAKLIFTRDGIQEINNLKSPEDYREILTTLFNITLKAQQWDNLISKVNQKMSKDIK